MQGEFFWLWVVLALAVSGGAAWFFIRKFLPAWRVWQEYAKKCATCGYLADPPTEYAMGWMRWYAKLVMYLRVGRVTVIGRENAFPPGPRIITPNHSGAADPAPFALILDDKPVRYMATSGVFTFGGNLGAMLAGPCGAFCVDITPGKGGRAGLAAIKALTTEQTVVMFPEGWAWMTGEIHPFKPGACKIAKGAAKKLGKPVYIVPTYMRYGRYPGKWILSLPWMAQYVWLMLTSLVFYRHGLTIVFGKPISSDDMPDDDEAATEMLFQAVKTADPLNKPVPADTDEIELQPSLLTLIMITTPLVLAAAHALALSFFTAMVAWVSTVFGIRVLGWWRRQWSKVKKPKKPAETKSEPTSDGK